MRDQEALLEDILASIEIIEGELKGVSEEKFRENIPLQDAVIRRFAVIGEASKHIEPRLRTEHKEVNWKDAAGMRDFLVHEYFDIDLGILWKAARTDLPVLKRAVQSLIEKL